MMKTVMVQRFKIYGNKVTMGKIATIQLKKIVNKTYKDGDCWTWIRKGPMYIRAEGNAHGFMILVEDDSE